MTEELLDAVCDVYDKALRVDMERFQDGSFKCALGDSFAYGCKAKATHWEKACQALNEFSPTVELMLVSNPTILECCLFAVALRETAAKEEEIAE